MVLTHPLSGNPVIHLLTREANSDPTCCSKGLCPTFKAQQSIHPPYHSHIRSIHHPSQQKSATTHTHTYHTTHHTTHHHHQWIGFHGKILTGNPWVFTIKFDGLSGSNFPIIQFYDIIHHPSPTSQPRRLQGLFQLAHLSVHRGQRRLQRGQGTASDLSHGEAMAHRNR